MTNRVGRTRHVGAAAGGAFRRTTHSGVYLPLDGGEPRQGWDPQALVAERGGLTWNDARDGEQVQFPDIGPDAVDGSTQIFPGSLPASTFDPDPPAVPTGLGLSSDVATNSDGTTYVRLLVTLTQPPDTDGDLYGSYVEVTSQNTAGVPVWDRPQQRFIPADQSQVRIENVQGVTEYWARARSVDVQGNYSAFTTTISHITVGDTTPPPTPNPPVVTAGYRGLGAFWTGGDAADLAYYEVRTAAHPTAAPDADDGAWAVIRSDTSTTFIQPLTENVKYWVEVRGVDLSGNRSAWSTGVSGTPTLIGASDIAANSITAAMIQAGALDADKISTGTLTIQSAGSAFAEGIRIINGSGQELSFWDENGLVIRDPGSPGYVILDAAAISFNDGSGEVAALSAAGLNASAITFGESQGGHNLLLNSSFEFAAFTSVPSTKDFTGNGAGQWVAGQRLTAPVNTTEGASDLQIAATGY